MYISVISVFVCICMREIIKDVSNHKLLDIEKERKKKMKTEKKLIIMVKKVAMLASDFYRLYNISIT